MFLLCIRYARSGLQWLTCGLLSDTLRCTYTQAQAMSDTLEALDPSAIAMTVGAVI